MTALPELTTTISSKQLSRLACHASSRNLVFVDGGVATRQTASPSEEKLLLEQTLVNSEQPQATYSLATPTTPIAEVVQLQPDQDSIAQISQVLAAHQGLESVHLTVSGQPGCLALGTTPLSLESLDRHANQLQTWATAFSADGELVISGYKVAKATEGREFVQRLYHLTGITVTASIVLTGSAVLGGDWELKMHVGGETPAAGSPLQAA
jgi:Domain of unknown function (DUF4347)